ncbi:hypothetical protein HPULCUR_003499 [Helicostylum pulchrum]|uniref:aminodeoxychorismate synthase n=1 Tax=Helicostylum pulchrum TaxID=562976 RepID=A0ABP9XTJ0_9FUNG
MIQHIKTLIIDNYDSYTFNLLQLFPTQTQVVVIRNDQFTWEAFKKDVLPYFDNVIISPGPGRPERNSDFGICTQLLQAQLDPDQVECHRPIFGVCLGHQGIGHIFGGKVIHAPRIMHGRMSKVHVKETSESTYKDILHTCPTPFWAVRYHSLIVEKDSLPEDLLLTAFCYENDADMDALKNARFLEDSQDEQTQEVRNHFLDHTIPDSQTDQVTIMAFQHKRVPIWGVQFHPESVSTEHGAKMIHNFQVETWRWMTNTNRPLSTSLNTTLLSYSAALPKLNHSDPTHNSTKFELYIKSSCPSWVDPESYVDELLSTQGDHYIGWLDSSRRSSPYSRMSVLSTDPAIRFTYSTLHKQLTMINRQNQETKLTLGTTFFDYVSGLLTDAQHVKCTRVEGPSKTVPDLEFQAGLMGYFGYEMKRESLEGYVTPEQQLCHCQNHGSVGCCKCVEEPDAAFQFVDRFLVFDQVERKIYICCLVKKSEPSNEVLNQVGFTHLQEAMVWINQQERNILCTAETLRRRKLADEFISLTPASSACTTPTPSVNVAIANDVFTPDVDHQDYLSTIEQCVDMIREGEAYEICLTTRFRLTLPKHISTKNSDPTLWRLYTRYLRKNNPAPFSALMMFDNLGLLSSSPERFLKVDKDHVAEMKPIKGTVARVLKCVCEEGGCDYGVLCQETMSKLDEERKQQLWQDVKERAENLMANLIRNDLAQVCTPSTVRVPKLMHVETYEKVHHLVSTVRGTLQPGVNSVEAIQKCFPPGSMTGAPKLRSVQLLDQLENHKPRGVYSGCLGYFSLNGSADFNVVIRTAVANTKAETRLVEVSVGGGGAITFLSSPEQEWKETLLKTKSVAPSVKEFLEDQ